MNDPSRANLKILATESDRSVRHTLWDSAQEALLIGCIVATYICNGRTYFPTALIYKKHIGHLFNALLDNLPSQSRKPREYTALFSKLKKMKNENRKNGRKLFSNRWKDFLLMTPDGILYYSVFEEKNFGIDLNDVISLFERDQTRHHSENIHRRITIERGNTWSILENTILIKSALDKFLDTCSMSPPKTQNSNVGEAWNEVHRNFTKHKKICRIDGPDRSVSAIERHFKTLKQVESMNLVHYFYNFKNLKQTNTANHSS